MTSSLEQDQTKLALYKAELKAAKNEKALIAKQFKNAVAGSAEYEKLINAMQASTKTLKDAEQKVKAIEKNIASKNYCEPAIIEKKPPLFYIHQDSNWPGSFSIQELNCERYSEWYDFVASIPTATAYHQPGWKAVIQKAFNNPTRIWVALDDAGHIIGGIPLTFFNSKLFGTFAVSIPYMNYGGVISRHFNVAVSILDHLKSVCVQEGLSHIEVRTMQANMAENSSSKKASMILELPGTSELLEKNLGSKLRAQYKKAEEHSPLIRFGKIELLNDFYHVFAKNMRDLGTPVYGKNWFSSILENESIDATIAVVYVNNKPVSTGFLVGHNGMLEIPWASTIKEANALNTNMWMYRKILDFAIANRFNFFDFGRSTQDAGTYKFKKQWGAIPYLHYWYKILPSNDTQAPELNPDNPKFSLMIKLWKLMPVWTTKIVGPLIIRNIP